MGASISSPPRQNHKMLAGQPSASTEVETLNLDTIGVERLSRSSSPRTTMTIIEYLDPHLIMGVSFFFFSMTKESSNVGLISGYFQAVLFFSTLFHSKQFKGKQLRMLYPCYPCQSPLRISEPMISLPMLNPAICRQTNNSPQRTD